MAMTTDQKIFRREARDYGHLVSLRVANVVESHQSAVAWLELEHKAGTDHQQSKFWFRRADRQAQEAVDAARKAWHFALESQKCN